MTTVRSTDYRLVVGIDVAAKTFPASWTTDRTHYTRAVTFEQTDAGLAQFQQRLHPTGVAPADTLVVLEASGSYWISLAVALDSAGFVVSVVNPVYVSRWAQSLPRPPHRPLCLDGRDCR
jgi:transposase